MKLKLRVEEFTRGVAIEVVYMDERFRSENHEFTAKNSFMIASDYDPGIEEDCLYLWGRGRNTDHLVACRQFDSESAKTKWLGNLDEALRDWAKNWLGWKEEEPEIKGNMWSY